MSHIVVYQSPDGSSGFEPCASLDAAIVAAERMRNVDNVETPRIFKMEEVQFDFRPYFRVEVSPDANADLSRLSAGSMSSLSAPASEPSMGSDFTSGAASFDAGDDADVAETSDTADDSPDHMADVIDVADETSALDDFAPIDFSAPQPESPYTTLDTPGSSESADLSAPLEQSLSAMGSLGSVESLNKLQESVEAFATHVDFRAEDQPPPPAPLAESDVSDFGSIGMADPEADSTDEVEDLDEIEPANDPLVSVRRGLFGR